MNVVFGVWLIGGCLWLVLLLPGTISRWRGVLALGPPEYPFSFAVGVLVSIVTLLLNAAFWPLFATITVLALIGRTK